jgi:uncharacterized protein YdbL (DUF1318 family)
MRALLEGFREMTPRLFIAAACAALALVAVAGPAAAIEDPILNAAINENKIGETADGYLATVDGATVAADARARMDQLNLRRRATYTDRAQQNSVSVEEYARSFACTLLPKNTPVGASYRDQGGSWRRNTGSVALPTYCPSAQ